MENHLLQEPEAYERQMEANTVASRRQCPLGCRFLLLANSPLASYVPGDR